MASAIRVRNLYFMLLYAWRLFPDGKEDDLPWDDGPDELNLFARILREGVKRLLRRGLNKGYVESFEETSSPRGRFLLSETLSRLTLPNGRAICSYTELTVDTVLNRILKTTMGALADARGLEVDSAHELRALRKRLASVAEIRCSKSMFRGVQLSGSSREYLLLLRVCELIAGRLLPGEGDGQSKFVTVLDDEVIMAQLFEAFLRNFLQVEQHRFSVSAAHIPWSVEAELEGDLKYIPAMRTDITLVSDSEVIVIDAKFYRRILHSFHGGSPKLRSGHLYQMQSYLRHSREVYGKNVSGILLYASTGEGELGLRYKIDGLPLQVQTLDLDRSWKEIASSILDVVKAPSRAEYAGVAQRP